MRFANIVLNATARSRSVKNVTYQAARLHQKPSKCLPFRHTSQQAFDYSFTPTAAKTSKTVEL
jgi:hypothetical protein